MTSSCRGVLVVLSAAVWISVGAGRSATVGSARPRLSLPAAAQDPAAAQVRPNSITYVGNSGYLLWVGDKKVLIDAVFAGYPGGYALPATVQDMVLNGRPPFDALDLILATHAHDDHFTASLMSSCLQHNPSAVLVAPGEAAAQVAGFGTRVRALTVPDGRRESLDVGGIRVEAMFLPHIAPRAGRRGTENLGYVVAIGGRRFFHSGDVADRLATVEYVRGLGLPGERIDYALIPHFLLSDPARADYVRAIITARVVIASHLQYSLPPNEAGVRRNFPAAIVLRPEMTSLSLE